MWLPGHVATRVLRGTVARPAAARVHVRSSSARNVFGPCVTCNARRRGPWHVATRESRGEAAPRRAAHAGVGRGMRLQRGSRGGVQRTRCGAAAGGVRLARVRGCSMSLQGGSHGGREAITKVARPIARPEIACARARSSSARNVCNTPAAAAGHARLPHMRRKAIHDPSRFTDQRPPRHPGRRDAWQPRCGVDQRNLPCFVQEGEVADPPPTDRVAPPY